MTDSGEKRKSSSTGQLQFALLNAGRCRVLFEAVAHLEQSMSGKTSTGQRQGSEVLQIALTTREKQIDRQREIATALYRLARALDWRVKGFQWGEIYKSYHWADLQSGENHFSMLFQQNSRVIALAHREAPCANWRFIDDPRVDAELKKLELPFVWASAAELAQDLTAADRALIAARPDVVSEYDMKYWKPETVGDVLYNFWD